MKQLTCEMCGSTEMLKQDGVFVCQTCGTKYTVEEAKKMMVEGTVEVQGTVKVQGSVEVDQSKAIENFISLANVAAEGHDIKGVLKYAEKILELDNTRFEGYALIAKTAGWESSLENPKLDKALAYAKKAIAVAENKSAVSTNLYLEFKKQISALLSNAINLNSGGQFQYTHTIMFEWINVLSNLPALSDDVITKEYYHIKKLCSFFNDMFRKPTTPDERTIQIVSSAARCINNLTPYHVTLSKTLNPAIAERCGILRDVAEEEAAKAAQPQKSGCYVATCVYGSYDCPQVWTLRRYRDYTLAETWHGRAFIRTYYAISPTLVKWFGHTECFKKMWKGKLDRMVAKLQVNGVESTPYEDRKW